MIGGDEPIRQLSGDETRETRTMPIARRGMMLYSFRRTVIQRRGQP